MLAPDPAQIPHGIAPVADKTQGLPSVEDLTPFLQVDMEILCLVHVVHAFIDHNLDSAQQIHQLFKSAEIDRLTERASP